MRILLLGEYSNVHNGLAVGLRRLGHEVTLASDGDGWKNYPRDVDLSRRSLGKLDSARFLVKVARALRHFRGYDVVQLVNPVFLPLAAERVRPLYGYLRRHNRCVVMGAHGLDYYYVRAAAGERIFRYGDFNVGALARDNEDNRLMLREWGEGAKAALCRHVAQDCDAIVAGLYEYYASYERCFEDKEKLRFIPFPIVTDNLPPIPEREPGSPARFFVGVQVKRSAYKGTDVMLRALRRLENDFPEACRVEVAESVPFARYVEMMRGSEVILDQLYSYTPAMNALEAMAQGLVVVGGGEPENYGILGETELRPIVNVLPDEEDVYQKLKALALGRDTLIPRLRRESREYVLRHHDCVKVARAHERLYRELLSRR